jgi:hypothetical protein
MVELSNALRGREFLVFQLGQDTSADRRFCGPRLFGPLMERSNSCARVGGHSHAVDNQTAAFVLFVGARAGVFVVA